ncbi:MAG: tyrosine-type recombinase/integrase [Ktedonobacteraceae bacterium]|nr:tyrosine-type recombinase/integrase [Ktedonobacteraceae bacterium]
MVATDEEELAEWGSAGEAHLFLSETRQPLTKNGMGMLFKRLKQRAGITGTRIGPHIFRHTFAMNYLIKSNDPFSLQELLGHEDLTTVLNYIHMNDTILQEQKRKFSPGDHLPTRMPGPRDLRRSVSAKKQPRKRETVKRSNALPSLESWGCCNERRGGMVLASAI